MEASRCFGSVSGTHWAEAYLIGGGPSLKGFDFGRLCGRTVVAVNDAVYHLPFATALFSLDLTWIRNRRKEVSAFAGERYLAVPDDFDFSSGPEATYLLRSRAKLGLSSDPTQIHMGGGNSGFGALNLAFLKGARRIILLGYDLISAGVHWHSGYAWQGAANSKMYLSWAERFDQVALQLASNGVEVLNASPVSAIKAFPKINLSDLPLRIPVQGGHR